MGVLQKQIIQDDKGVNVGIVLSMSEYESMMTRLEELEDLLAYDQAKREPSDPKPFKDFLKELDIQV
jgi:PHD/YefM family antitoxin component YafN of YafNO toxin-antitoxin module